MHTAFGAVVTISDVMLTFSAVVYLALSAGLAQPATAPDLPAAPGPTLAPTAPGPAPTVTRVSEAALRADAMDEWLTRSAAFGGHEWVTRPSRDAVIGFTIPMEIEKIEVVGGQVVKEGQILARGREGEAVASLEVQRVRAANTGPVDNALAALELAQIRLDAAEKAMRQDAFGQSEYEERRVAVVSARAALVNAQAQTQEEIKRIKQLEEQVERYRLRARFDGIVEMIVGDAGTSVDIQQPVVRLVGIDPLWIDVPVPTAETLSANLQLGSPAWVLLDVPEPVRSKAAGQGRVLYVSPVVDASGARRVRVELPNPNLLPAGTRARVRFSPPASANASASAAANPESSR